MVALSLKNLVEHQASIFKQLQAFRKEGQLCDVVVKSVDGTEHRAHKAVLCAASVDLRNMLLGPFVEAHQVQQGQPVQIAASDAVVLALLEYIYGGQLHVELEDSLELLRLADAYGFPQLAAMIQAELGTVLESASVATALKVLRHARDLPELSAKCEAKVAANFEMCIELVDFVELSTGQLGRILRRDDLSATHEEVVVQGLFNWFNRSKDRADCFGALLHHIDFQCLSLGNLIRLQHLSASIGPVGHDLQREVGDALQVHRRRRGAVRPKRCCLQNWSPELGASSQGPRRVLPYTEALCCHDGAIYFATYDSLNPSSPSSILRWKPGDAQSETVVGRGARVNGADDLGSIRKVSVSPEGDIFCIFRTVSNFFAGRLVSFRNGSGDLVLNDVDIQNVFCSPNGGVYVLTESGSKVERLVGATLQPVIPSYDPPEELQFRDLFVTKDDVIYLSDCSNGRILRIKPGEAEPVMVGEVPNYEGFGLGGLFVTEDEKIYVVDIEQGKVWAFHPEDTAWTEVLPGAVNKHPVAVLVQGRSLYVSMFGQAGEGIYEYRFPPELQLG